MAVLEIRLYGDPVLNQRSDPVTRFDAELARFGDDLLETLRAAHGAGLAAPQVGVLKRMFAYDIPPDEETGEHPFGVLVNPVITRWEGEQEGEEGCLSFPGIYYACKRAMAVTVAAVDVRGQAAGAGRRGAAGPLHPARDRPPGRGAVHRADVAGRPQAGPQGVARARARPRAPRHRPPPAPVGPRPIKPDKTL